MPRTTTISISANTCSLLAASVPATADIGRGSAAALLSVRAQRDDLERRAPARRAIHVAMAPGIARHHTAPQIRPVPALCVVTLGQRGQPFIAGRITTEIEKIQIERAGEALDLDLCGLRLGLAET